jgi:hypothetical protein
MKIKYTRSILEQVDIAIDNATKNNVAIDYIELSDHEYVQFLEEISPTQRILLSVPPKRCYRLTQLRIIP